MKIGNGVPAAVAAAVLVLGLGACGASGEGEPASGTPSPVQTLSVGPSASVTTDASTGEVVESDAAAETPDSSGPVTGVPADDSEAEALAFETLRRAIAAIDAQLLAGTDSMEEIERFTTSPFLEESELHVSASAGQSVDVDTRRQLKLLDAEAAPQGNGGEGAPRGVVQLDVCVTSVPADDGDGGEGEYANRQSARVVLDQDSGRWAVESVVPVDGGC